MALAVKINNLNVTLSGNFKALKNIDLDLPEGKIIGLIGPSGAGKTTLIKAIVGSLAVSSGEVLVLELPAGSESLRKTVSYMAQELSVYSDLTVKENLKYFITISGQPRKKVNSLVHEVLRLVDLSNKANNLVSELSGGQKQRVSLAVALIGSPKLIVLDEPTVGLDPVLREKIWNLFSRLAIEGKTLIVSSHSMDEAARCEDLVLIRDGQIIAHSSPRDFLNATSSKSVEEGFLKLVGGKV